MDEAVDMDEPKALDEAAGMLVRLAGDPTAQGLRHADAMPPAARRHLLGLIEALGPRSGEAAGALLEAARRLAPETVETVEGLGLGLGVPFERLWAYTVRGYVSALGAAGCSVAARGGPRPLLAKNRDFSRSHAPLQALFAVSPARGHAWISLGSFGSPGVYSSGMNVVGLAVADAHVPTRALGPGLLRFSLMQQLLERCADVPGAVEHLRQADAADGGAIALADAAGGVACVELAHGRAAVRRPGPSGWVTATNHFRHPAMRGLNRPPQAGAGDDATSRPRAARLRAAVRPITSPEGLLRLLATHGGPLDSLCRHTFGAHEERATLASVVYEPGECALVARLGLPCRTAGLRIRWTGTTWSASEER